MLKVFSLNNLTYSLTCATLPLWSYCPATLTSINWLQTWYNCMISFLRVIFHCLHSLCFPVPPPFIVYNTHDTLDASHTFPTTVLESTISPMNLGPFYWKMVFRSQDLGTGWAQSAVLLCLSVKIAKACLCVLLSHAHTQIYLFFLAHTHKLWTHIETYKVHFYASPFSYFYLLYGMRNLDFIIYHKFSNIIKPNI